MNPIVLEARRRGLPVADWPELDRQAWAAATGRRTGLRSKVGLANKWAPASQTAVEKSWGRFLGFLLRDGRLDASVGPAARCTPDNLEAFFAHLEECGNRRSTIVERFGHIAMMLQVTVPGFDTSFITTPGGVPLGRRLRDDRPEKLLFDSRFILARVEELFARGIGMRSDARRRTAVRDAALLAVLTTAAPRQRSLLAMEVGIHLIRTDTAYELYFRPPNMKEHNYLEGEFPSQVTPILDRYLSVERRELLGMAGHDSVWVNVRGEPLGARAVDGAVRARTRQLLGHEMGTHAFRHCLTTTAVLTSSQAALDVPVVLGHGLQVSLEHYNRATAVAVAARYGEQIVARTRRLSSLAASAYGWRDKKKNKPKQDDALY
jgi:hypothetical protein